MRKIAYLVFVAIALTFAIPVRAQFDWGIKGGVNLGNNDLTILKDKERILSMENYTGFFIGPKAEVRIPSVGLGFELAAFYSQQGMELTNNEIFEQNCFQFPLHIKYNLGMGNKANIFFAAGPEFGFNVGETSMVVNNLRNNETTGESLGDLSAYFVEKYTLSINVGLGFTLFKHFQMGINYNMPWDKTGEFTYIEASEIENAKDIQNGENITIDNIKTLIGTGEKVHYAYNNIKSGIVQVSMAYLF